MVKGRSRVLACLVYVGQIWGRIGARWQHLLDIKLAINDQRKIIRCIIYLMNPILSATLIATYEVMSAVHTDLDYRTGKNRGVLEQ